MTKATLKEKAKEIFSSLLKDTESNEYYRVVEPPGVDVSEYELETAATIYFTTNTRYDDATIMRAIADYLEVHPKAYVLSVGVHHADTFTDGYLTIESSVYDDGPQH